LTNRPNDMIHGLVLDKSKTIFSMYWKVQNLEKSFIPYASCRNFSMQASTTIFLPWGM
jgi:hypothetical protein